MSVNHPIRIGTKVFLPSDVIPENHNLYSALLASWEDRREKSDEKKEAKDENGVVCLCVPGGVPLVIRRINMGRNLILARWPGTESEHTDACHFRHSTAFPGILSGTPVAQGPGNPALLNWDFPNSDGEGFRTSTTNASRTARRGVIRKSKTPPRDSLGGVLRRLWLASGLDVLQGEGPKDWFDAANKIVNGSRELSFGQGKSLEDYLRIWARPTNDKSAWHNATVDTSGHFLAIGEVRSLLRMKFRGYLPFWNYPADLTVFCDYEKVISAIGGNTAIEWAPENKRSYVIGLAHVFNNGQTCNVVSLTLMHTDLRYIPIRP